MIREILVQFAEWTKLKVKIHLKEGGRFYFYEREVWWASLGLNIGYEQDGKNEGFERPVLVLKKQSRHLLWVIPLTGKEKNDRFHCTFLYQGHGIQKEGYAIISQLRSISSKRLKRKMGVASKAEFQKMRDRVIKELS